MKELPVCFFQPCVTFLRIPCPTKESPLAWVESGSFLLLQRELCSLIDGPSKSLRGLLLRGAGWVLGEPTSGYWEDEIQNEESASQNPEGVT